MFRFYLHRSIIQRPYGVRCMSALAQEAYKPPIALVGKLRKETKVSLAKAREALVATRGDYSTALEWLHKDAAASGAKKAEKLSDRQANQGVIVVAGDYIGSQGLVMMEMNSETDFVARNKLFLELASRVASTAWTLRDELAVVKEASSETDLLHGAIDTTQLLSCPLLPDAQQDKITMMNEMPDGKTIHQHVIEHVGKLGENIQLRRLVSMHSRTNLPMASPFVYASYVHSSQDLPSHMGRVGAMVAFKIHYSAPPTPDIDNKVHQLTRKVAQHVVALNPPSLLSCGENQGLIDQDFFFGGGTVKQVLKSSIKNVELECVQFYRYECGQ